jgi:hypothetical protein
MKTDYTYCANKGTCLHRRACLRWLGNYSDEEVKELMNNHRAEFLDDGYCMDSVPYPFDALDRFRLSDGSEFKNGFTNS